MKHFIAWYKQLRRKDVSVIMSLVYAHYNYKYYNLDGTYRKK